MPFKTTHSFGANEVQPPARKQESRSG